MKTIKFIISLVALCQLSTLIATADQRPPVNSSSEVVFEVRQLSNSTKSEYQALKAREGELTMLIKQNELNKQNVSKAKARKIDKENATLNSELSATKRILDTYPQSVTNPEYNTPTQYKKSTTPTKTQSAATTEICSTDICYRVLFKISPKSLSEEELTGLKNILIQSMPNGQTIYYQGSYTTKAEAEHACQEIKKHTSFNDAFIVAMRGTQRVSL